MSGRQRRRELKRSLRAGDELAFFSGDKVLSHTIQYERGRYRMRAADGDGAGRLRHLRGA